MIIVLNHVSALRKMNIHIVRTEKSLHGANREGVHLALSPKLGTELEGALI